ncbi:MAG: FG-GAP repeat domain-containing protein [bacterium]
MTILNKFADLDNDGDFDVVVTGIDINEEFHAEIYECDSSGKYIFQNRLSLGLYMSIVSFGDFNNDNLVDLCISGSKIFDISTNEYRCNNFFTGIYENRGNLEFSRLPFQIIGLYSSNSKWFDFDNDGDADLLISGKDCEFNFRILLYENLGSNDFKLKETNLIGNDGYIEAYDYDKDGDVDVLIYGRIIGYIPLTELYNNVDGTFIKSGYYLGEMDGEVKLRDFNNDGKVDILLTGGDLYIGYLMTIFILRKSIILRSG